MNEPSQEERDRNYYAVASARQLTHEARLRSEDREGRMRYRVLYRLDGVEDAEPCGVIMERENCVEVVAPAELGFPTVLEEPFRRMGRDLEIEEIRPDNPDYFDECCAELHRSFAMGRELEAARPSGVVLLP